MIRPFIKWDDQPASLNAALHSIVRAYNMTSTKPTAPTYVCLDVTVQERKVTAADVNLPDPSRYIAGPPAGAAAEDVDRLVDMLRSAKRPLFMIGRVKRDEAAWRARIELVEKLGAAVITDLKNGAAFPYPHPRHPVPPSTFLPPPAGDLIKAADVILVLDWIDLAGTFKSAYGGRDGAVPDARIVTANLDTGLHNGWSKDSGALPPADLALTVDADRLLEALHARVVKDRAAQSNGVHAVADWPPAAAERAAVAKLGSTPTIFQSQFAAAVYGAVEKYPYTMMSVRARCSMRYCSFGIQPRKPRLDGRRHARRSPAVLCVRRPDRSPASDTLFAQTWAATAVPASLRDRA
jgi:thiamine pyrophosphate-dependent acetolactate synthase large subunit-like protein